MHVLKALISLILLIASLGWLSVQKLFFYSSNGSASVDVEDYSSHFEELKEDWCRIRKHRYAWQEILTPCLGEHSGNPKMLSPRFATDVSKSRISSLFIKPAGEHTKVFITSYAANNGRKTFGGDAWRVLFRGTSVVAATVFDHGNGIYEAVTLLTTPGLYKLDIMLDYTQCKGMKDPPTEWFVKAHCSGKRKNSTQFISSNILSDMSEYINKPLGEKGFTIFVPPARYNISDLPLITRGLDCGIPCNLMWDGYGEWTSDGKVWRPYISEWNDHARVSSPEEASGKRLLWIYGDSLSYYFYKSLENKPLCNEIFTECRNTYNWIYPKTLYELRHTCSDVDLRVDLVKKFLMSISTRRDMDKNSVLLFNAGAHYVKNTSFKKYMETINALIEVIKGTYTGTPVWRSSAAVHTQTMVIMGAFRRYITGQRLELFNAYANAAMCNADILLMDTYPLTASYPFGTKDGIHYDGRVSEPLKNLVQMFFMNGKQDYED